MKIALILTESHPLAQRNAYAHFLNQSSLPSADYQCWTLPDSSYAEPALAALEEQYRRSPVDLLLFPAGWQGAEWATRLAWRLNGDALCDVMHGEFVNGDTVTKKACGGAIMAELQLHSSPWCLSMAAVPGGAGKLPEMPVHTLTSDTTQPPWLIASQPVTSNTVSDLQLAKRVLAVGRGVTTPQNMTRLHDIAASTGMVIGASREAVMHAWCPMDRLLGISGMQIAPDICIVAGASGASALMSGISQSQFIVAINNDPHAPVFQQADVGIVDEMMPVLEALNACITEDI